MRQNKSQIASLLAVFCSMLLTILKLSAGILSNSQSLISDGLNSLLDIVSGTIIFVAIRVGGKKADDKHPFGHNRAEPIAALVIAILAGILSFEIIRDGITSILHRTPVEVTNFTFFVVFFSVGLKTIMMLAFRRIGRASNSPSLKAAAIDFRNDIFASSMVIVAVITAKLGLSVLDSYIAILLGLWIAYSGFNIAQENLKYLMGESPDGELLKLVHDKASGILGVKQIHAVKAQYLGSEVEVVVDIEIDKRLTLQHAHEIGEHVKQALEETPEICHAFVHIDPV